MSDWRHQDIPPEHFPPSWVFDAGYVVKTYGIPAKGEEIWSFIRNEIVNADGTELHPRVVLHYVGNAKEEFPQGAIPPPRPAEVPRCPTCAQVLPAVMAELAKARPAERLGEKPIVPRPNLLPFREPRGFTAIDARDNRPFPISGRDGPDDWRRGR